MMNEEELRMKRMIEKREKKDTILSYILLFILLGCVLFMLYLKFIRKEESRDLEEEYTPDVISLEEISSSLMNSVLANRYSNDKATFNTRVTDDLIVVTYALDDINLTLNMSLIGSELQIPFDGTNDEIITDIYKEVANTVCVYYDNSETSCKSFIDNVSDNNTSVQGIRFDNTGNNSYVYIDIMKKMDISSIEVNSDVNEVITYTTSTVVDLSNTAYILSLNNTKISDINISTDEINLKFTGNIENLDSANSMSVVIRLYTDNDVLLKEETKELQSSDTNFELLFVFDDNLKLEDIRKYSIDIVR